MGAISDMSTLTGCPCAIVPSCGPSWPWAPLGTRRACLAAAALRGASRAGGSLHCAGSRWWAGPEVTGERHAQGTSREVGWRRGEGGGGGLASLVHDGCAWAGLALKTELWLDGSFPWEAGQEGGPGGDVGGWVGGAGAAQPRKVRLRSASGCSVQRRRGRRGQSGGEREVGEVGGEHRGPEVK